MPKCNNDHHGHHGHVGKSDVWTKIATSGEAVASFISDGYWLGELIDSASGLEAEILGLSRYGISIGFAISLVTAVGTAYSHNMLNRANQTVDSEHHHHHHSHQHQEVDLEAAEPADNDDHSDALQIDLDDLEVVVHHGEDDSEQPLLADKASHQHPEHAHRKDDIKINGDLTVGQKAALVADFISHTGDIAGPITFISKLALKEIVPPIGKVLIECGATLFAGFASVANVRSCANSMRKINKAERKQEAEAQLRM